MRSCRLECVPLLRCKHHTQVCVFGFHEFCGSCISGVSVRATHSRRGAVGHLEAHTEKGFLASHINQHSMDFLMASLAPTVLPGLQRSLEMAFLAGLVTSKKLLAPHHTPLPKRHGLPMLPKRERKSPDQNTQQVGLHRACPAHFAPAIRCSACVSLWPSKPCSDELSALRRLRRRGSGPGRPRTTLNGRATSGTATRTCRAAPGSSPAPTRPSSRRTPGTSGSGHPQLLQTPVMLVHATCDTAQRMACPDEPQ